MAVVRKGRRVFQGDTDTRSHELPDDQPSQPSTSSLPSMESEHSLGLQLVVAIRTLAAQTRSPGFKNTGSLAAQTRSPGFKTADSLAAQTRSPGFKTADSLTAQTRSPGFKNADFTYPLITMHDTVSY